MYLYLGVTQGEAADKAGMRPGDVITKVNDSEVNAIAELQGLIATYRPGDKVKVTFERKGQELTTTVILKNRTGGTALVKKEEKKTAKVLGAELQALGKEEQKTLNVLGGVKIVRLNLGKIKDAGIKEGFIITKLTLSGISEPQSVNSPEDIKRIIEEGKGAVWVEGLYPDGKRGYYPLNL